MSNSSQGEPELAPAAADVVALDSLVDGIRTSGDGQERDYAALAERFFDLLRQPGVRSSAEKKQLEKAFDCLVSDGKYLALHRLVLSRHSSEGAKKGALSTVAHEFGQRLLELAAAAPTPSTGILIALLILRSVLAPSATIERLPAWHLQAIPAFDAEESLLLYNTMFDQRAFLQNVAELKMALPALDWVDQWRNHGVKKIYAFLYFWPAGADTRKLQELLRVLNTQASASQITALADLRAALTRAVQSTSGALERGSSDDLNKNMARLWGVLKQYGLQRLGLAGRRPRVAICISGQLRGYEAALRSWRKHLLPGLDADFYVHAWTQIGRSGSEPFRRFLPFDGAEFERCYREQCMKMGYAEFVQHYPGLFKSLSTSSEVTTEHVKQVYGTEQVVLESDSDPEFAEWSNPRKMHYKIAQVQALVEKSGHEYDMILRVRPDKAFRLLLASWRNISLMANSQPLILADAAMGVHYGNLMIGDQIALGSPQTMRVYSATYGDVVSLGNLAFQGHASLARQCYLHGIHVGKFPAIFGGLLGAAPLSSKEIQQEILKDSAGRADPVDKILLAAVAKDLSAT